MKHILLLFIIYSISSFAIFSNDNEIWYTDETGQSRTKEVDTAYIRQTFNDSTLSMNERMNKIDSVFGFKWIENPYSQMEQERNHSENMKKLIPTIILIGLAIIGLRMKQRKK